MEIKDDKVLFSTGKEVCANCGIIGLSPHGKGDPITVAKHLGPHDVHVLKKGHLLGLAFRRARFRVHGEFPYIACTRQPMGRPRDEVNGAAVRSPFSVAVELRQVGEAPGCAPRGGNDIEIHVKPMSRVFLLPAVH